MKLMFGHKQKVLTLVAKLPFYSNIYVEQSELSIGSNYGEIKNVETHMIKKDQSIFN